MDGYLHMRHNPLRQTKRTSFHFLCVPVSAMVQCRFDKETGKEVAVKIIDLEEAYVRLHFVV